MLLSILVPLLLLFQVVPGRSPQASKFSISGTVSRAEMHAALAGARVTLTRSTSNQPGNFTPLPAPTIPARNAAPANVQVPPVPSVVTDGEGKFTLPNLDEGTYTLQVQANGYLPQNYGQRSTGGPGIPIRLSAGQTVSSLSISLIPAGNISGRVRDIADKPLINVPVQLLRFSYSSQGQRSYQLVGTLRTNDRGEFRFYWLAPGRYHLLAGTPTSTTNPEAEMMINSINNAMNPNLSASDNMLGYAFYPGVTEFTSAAAIDLQPGSNLSGVDVTLSPRPQTFSIRGRIVDSRTGQPPSRVTINAVPQIPGASSSNSSAPQELRSRGYNSATGSFEVRNLLPGTYMVTARVEDSPFATREYVDVGGGPNSTPPPRRLIGTATIVIPKADVDGVVIPVISTAAISGRVRVDGTLANGAVIRVQMASVSPMPAAPSGSFNNAGAKADGTFQFFNIVPGDYRLSVIAPVAGGAIYIKDARFEGTDVLNNPWRVGEPGNGQLEIVAGVTAGRVSGTLTDQGSQPVVVSQVVLIPERSRDRLELYRSIYTDDKGNFLFNGIAPGDYRVVSWDGLEPNAWFDPEVMLRMEARGQFVHVTDASNDTIQLKLNPTGTVQR